MQVPPTKGQMDKHANGVLENAKRLRCCQSTIKAQLIDSTCKENLFKTSMEKYAFQRRQKVF